MERWIIFVELGLIFRPSKSVKSAYSRLAARFASAFCRFQSTKWFLQSVHPRGSLIFGSFVQRVSIMSTL